MSATQLVIVAVRLQNLLTRSELTGGAGGRVWDMEGCQTGLFLCALGVEEIAQATRGIRIGCVGISCMLVSALEDPGGT